MRLTIILLAKTGAMKLYVSVAVLNLDMIKDTIKLHIPDYFKKEIWGGELNEIVQKGDTGWTKSRMNLATGERSFITFYNKIGV